MAKSSLFLPLLLASALFADDSSHKEEATLYVHRSECLAIQDVLEDCADPYFEGYIQALIDMNYYEYKVVAIVKDREVFLTNLPKNKLVANSIVSFVRDVPGVKGVKLISQVPAKDKQIHERYARKPKIRGVWFPQTTELYLPMIADPRQVIYSLGYRWADPVIGKSTAVFSLGDDFPIYRWLGVWHWCGDLQISIEAGIWSVFDVDPESYRTDKWNPGWAECTACVNTDYYVGIPLVYAVDEWAFRFRIYHESCHIGDEFIFNNPQYVSFGQKSSDEVRKNPSMEVIDLFASYQATEAIRVYGGVGYIFHSDPTFPMKPFYFEYGGEGYFLKTKFDAHGLIGSFFAAMYFRNWEDTHYKLDQTYMLGYVFSKIQGVGRKIRFAVEYHDGFSVEGQFMKTPSHYWQVRFLYGF